GFINLRLTDAFLQQRLLDINSDLAERLGIEKTDNPENIVVDFSGPNIAKQMHVGHLRSTIIGDCICRMFEFAGHNVIRQNHIGDWGTQFGRVILGFWHLCMADKHGNPYYLSELEKLKEYAKDKERLEELCCKIRDRHEQDYLADVYEEHGEYGDGKRHFGPFLAKVASEEHDIREKIQPVYQFVSTLEDSVAGMGLSIPTRNSQKEPISIPYESLSRHITAMLQRGGHEDVQEREAWKIAKHDTLEQCQKIYDLLKVTLTEKDVRGESEYKDDLPGIVEDLKKLGLAKESEGATCVFPEGFLGKEGDPLPFIIRKSDGAFLYATTDLAAMKYRIGELKADRIIYVTDARQQLHFKMLFATAKMAGWLDDDIELCHVTFGTMMGTDGRPFKTRSGENVKLADLLTEAVEQAKRVVEEKNAELSDEQKQEIAKAVGIGAVKYADFSNNRTTDYVFSFDKMLAMEGNTAPYMQYAYARVKSIERKAVSKGIDIAAELAGIKKLSITEGAESDLAKHLIRYGEAIRLARADCKPNCLTAYLFDLAQKFSSFYNACPVLIAGEDKRPTRLLLCDLTARTMKHGLNELLGIETVEQM
ncbi:MAG: arginine--tRNA ligase, partial [Planctomycetes bacterium]|nr:arginine--tRNA ligase [Planctomycetota bacterium]